MHLSNEELLNAGLVSGLILALAIAVIVAALAFFFSLEKRKRISRAYLKSTLADLDYATGENFERYLLAFFESQGYRGHLTDKSHDYGADLVLHKDGRTTVVQAKRYRGRVGVAAVQQVVGAKSYYKADDMIVATNAYFTAPAKKLAAANHVTLLDREYFKQQESIRNTQ